MGIHFLESIPNSNKMSSEKEDLENFFNEKEDIETIATIVVSQPSNVVVIQPGRKLPGRWSTGLLFNDPCCLACLFPCLHYVWAIQIGRKAGLPGFCETQGCCFITFCCCLAFNTNALKARMLTQMRLGIRSKLWDWSYSDGADYGDQNEMIWHLCCFSNYLGQTKKTLDDNADIMAAPFDKNDIAYNI